MGTGSGHDLVPQSLVSASSLSLTEPSTPVYLSTANGPVAVESIARIHVAALGSTSEALALPSTPMVLSVGRRCMEEGYTFVWEAKQNPYMKTPEGQIIPLSVDGYTPYLNNEIPQTLFFLLLREPLAVPGPPLQTHHQMKKSRANVT